MHTSLRLYLIVSVFVLLFSCGSKKKEKNSESSVILPPALVEPKSVIPEPGIWEHEEIIFVHVEYIPKGNKRIIHFRNLKSNDTISQPMFDIDISSFDGFTSTSKYNTSGGYYSIQFSKDLSHIYIGIESYDEMEGTFHFAKIIEYTPNDKQFRDIVSFDELVPNFGYFELNHSIYWEDRKTGSLLAVRLDSLTIDTFPATSEPLQSIEFITGKEQMELISYEKEKFIRYAINENEKILDKKEEYTMGPFKGHRTGGYSSYRNGYLVETFLDFKNSNDEGLAIHSKNGKIQKNIDFKNFGTDWLNDHLFTLETDKKLLILDKELNIIHELERAMVHVEEAFDQSVLVVYWAEGWHTAVYSADLSMYKDLTEFTIDHQLIYAGVRK